MREPLNIALLRCPRHGDPLVPEGDGWLVNQVRPEVRYRVVAGLPLLVDFEDSVLDEAQTIAGAASPIVRPSYGGVAGFAKRLVSPGRPETRSNVARILSLVQGKPTTVLVVGGGTVGQGMRPLYDDAQTHMIAFDIYASPEIDFVADAHQVPLADACVDVVVIQAVLEHVLDPAQVVAELKRVLRDGGLVYAETPFMQQVHEGAYDFHRFTESAHRWLFRDFALIDSGVCGGAGAQLQWSIGYFARSLFRSRTVGRLSKLAFFWLPLLDRFIPASFASDTASGFYFLGRKEPGHRMAPRDIIAFYRGAQR